MKKKDMKMPFGEIIKYISEHNVEGLEKICEKHKANRCCSKLYSEDFDMIKTNSDDLISIGYNRALIDIMQAFMEEIRAKETA